MSRHHIRAERHSFRQRLRSDARAASSDEHDLKLFAVSFTAFFVCFYTFLL